MDTTSPEGGEESAAPFALKNFPPKTTVLAAFEKATAADPGNALYWQAVGDAGGDGLAANEACRRAADLKPRNAATLWYLLYNSAAASTISDPVTKWPVALDYLHRAQARDKGNAWPLYEEAGILFRSALDSATGPSGNRSATPKQQEAQRAAVRNDVARRNGRRAIDLITNGNRAPRYDSFVYADSVPALLAAAWHYASPLYPAFGNMARVRELARAGAGYAQFMAEFEKKPEEAERAAWAVVGLGNRMIGDWPIEDDPARGKTVVGILVGIAVASIGYLWLERVYETLGETGKGTAAQAENAAFMQRVDAYRKAVTASITRTEFDYY